MPRTRDLHGELNSPPSQIVTCCIQFQVLTGKFHTESDYCPYGKFSLGFFVMTGFIIIDSASIRPSLTTIIIRKTTVRAKGWANRGLQCHASKCGTWMQLYKQEYNRNNKSTLRNAYNVSLWEDHAILVEGNSSR